MNNFNHMVINKNRGWRGLAEVIILNEANNVTARHIFSFSQAMWKDMMDRNEIVVQDDTYYYVIKFTRNERLPRPDQQRSVLIKDFRSVIENVNKYEKAKWSSAPSSDWAMIRHFIKNKNNHTISDWNCIGVRVIPEI